MKKSIVIIILIIMVGAVVYYWDTIMGKLNEESIFIRIKRYVGVLEQEHEMRIANNSERDRGINIFKTDDTDQGFNLGNLGIKKILNDNSEDRRLIDALARQDEAEVSSILDAPGNTANENNEIVRILKKFSSRPRNVRDVAGLTCLHGVAPCSKKRYDVPTDTKQMEHCLTSKLALMNMELNKYPGCANEIRKFYAVTYLCSLKEDEEICALLDSKEGVDSKEQEEALKKHLMRNGVPKTNCVMNLAVDISAKNKCFENIPGYKEPFDKELSAYCKTAVGCHAFSDMSGCTDKYKKLFEHDIKNDSDCRNLHLTCLAQEFEILNMAISEKSADQTACDVVNQYEQMVHIEKIFDESSTIDEYSQKVVNAMNDPNMNINYLKVPVLVTTITNDYSKKVSDYTLNYNYYNACRISHLGPGRHAMRGLMK